MLLLGLEHDVVTKVPFTDLPIHITHRLFRDDFHIDQLLVLVGELDVAARWNLGIRACTLAVLVRFDETCPDADPFELAFGFALH